MMKRIVRLLVCSIPLMMLAACGGGGGDPAPGSPGTIPSVIAVTPADGTTGVAPGTNAAPTTIKVTFDKAMDPASITASNALIPGSPSVGNGTFTVSYVAESFTSITPVFGNATTVYNKTFVVPGTLTHDATNKIFTFTPTAPLTAFDYDQTLKLTLPTHAPRTFTVTIKGGANGVKTAVGSAMTVNKASSFTIWAGTQESGTVYDDVVNGIGTDGGNNVYMAGYTKGSLGATNPKVGTADILLMKYDANGAPAWPQPLQLGSKFDDQALGIAVDNSSPTPQLVVAGYTDGTLPGMATAQANPDTSGNTHNYFVMTSDFDGTKTNIKVTQAGPGRGIFGNVTSVSSIARAVATDVNGNIYVTGETNGNLRSFGVNSYTANYQGGTDIFVAKYDHLLNLVWTRLLGTTGDDVANGIAVDANSYVYITGQTAGTLPGATGSGAIFVAKFNASGGQQWIRQFGSTPNDHANAITVASNGFLFVAGGTFGSPFGTNVDNSGTTSDFFVAKIDAAGTLIWGQQLGTASNDDAFGVVTDAIGNVFVTGYTFGSLPGNVDGITSSGGVDIFVVKYDGSGTSPGSFPGNKLWSTQLGSPQSDEGKAVAAFVGPNGTSQNPAGFLYVAGYTYGNLDTNFNQDATYQTSDYFLAKYNATTGAKF